ncbi:phosphate ABC transporter substrate-binding protein [Fundidesulfovibrio butyratiphilus]
MRGHRFLLVLFLCLAGVLCAPERGSASGVDAFAGLSGELRIVGCEPGLVVVRQLAQKVMDAYPDVKVVITPCPMGAAISRVHTGAAQLAMFERVPLASLSSQGRFLITAYAVDPVALAVNPINPVSDVSVAQARDLFTGRVHLWSEIGGRKEFVLPAIVDASVSDGPGAGHDTLPKLTSQSALRLNLTRNRDILGILSVRALDAATKPLRLDGVEPSLENFRSGKYRVYRLLRMVSEENPSELTRAFLDLALGKEGQRLVEDAGYVPLAKKPAQPSLLGVDTPEGLFTGQ